jgi:hypothetical protein
VYILQQQASFSTIPGPYSIIYMITILTTAKPFVGQNRINQVNALKSWRSLTPDIEILLFGNGVGYGEAVEELGITHITDVEKSEQGVPLVNSMLVLAQTYGRYPVQAYVNCDIILLNDFLSAIQQVNMDHFLLIGQRWDIDLNREIDFEDNDWRNQLRQQINLHGHLHPAAGADYFVYKGPVWDNLPRLVAGRAMYDNELIYHCLATNVPVIDITDVVTVVHQNHDYGHHPQGVEGVWWGSEAQTNRGIGRYRKLKLEQLPRRLGKAFPVSPDSG